MAVSSTANSQMTGDTQRVADFGALKTERVQGRCGCASISARGVLVVDPVERE